MQAKIYVAGSSSDIETVRRVQRLVREAGHEVIGDWTLDVEAAGTANAGLNDSLRYRVASKCTNSIRQCHGVILATPLALSRGMLIEMGYALALGKSVKIFDESSDGSTLEAFIESTVFAALTAGATYGLVAGERR